MTTKPLRLLLSVLSAFFLPAMSVAANSPETVVFVDGAGQAEASRELTDAFARLARTGGTIVLRGPVRIDDDFVAPAHAAPVTITSRHGGNDYRQEAGAKLVMGGTYTINGPSTFAALVIAPAAKSSRIYCEGHPVVFARGRIL